MKAAAFALACFLALALVAAPAAPAGADPREVLPYNHWAYAALYRLAASGLAPLWAASARPLSRGEVAVMVAQATERAGTGSPGQSASTGAASQSAGTVAPGPGDLADLEALQAEFAEELRMLAAGEAPPAGPRLGIGVTGWLSSGPAPRDSRHSGSGVELGRLYLAGRVARKQGPGGTQTPEGTQGSGGAQTSEGSRGVLAGLQGILADLGRNVTLQAGRDTLRWGPGYRGAFLLSDNAGPLDFLRLSATGERLRFTKLVGPLADRERWLYALRLDWRASDTLRVGLGEVVVGQGGPYWFYALNPVPGVSYAALVHLRGRAGFNDNYNLALDFDWALRPGVVLYGELYADDLVLTPDNPFPHRIGGTVGLFLRDPFGGGRTTLRFEHSRVTNWVYAVTGHTSDYIKAGRPPGHWCAPDCELWSVSAARLLAPDRALEVGYDLIRKGEGALGDLWTDAAQAWARLYLSGVVETTHALRATYTFARPRGSSHTVGVRYSTIANAGHVPGASRQDWFFMWEASYGF